MKRFIFINSDGRFLWVSISKTHGGRKANINWVDDINTASAYLSERELEAEPWQGPRRPDWRQMVPVTVTRTVTIEKSPPSY